MKPLPVTAFGVSDKPSSLFASATNISLSGSSGAPAPKVVFGNSSSFATASIGFGKTGASPIAGSSSVAAFGASKINSASPIGSAATSSPTGPPQSAGPFGANFAASSSGWGAPKLSLFGSSSPSASASMPSPIKLNTTSGSWGSTAGAGSTLLGGTAEQGQFGKVTGLGGGAAGGARLGGLPLFSNNAIPATSPSVATTAGPTTTLFGAGNPLNTLASAASNTTGWASGSSTGAFGTGFASRSFRDPNAEIGEE